MAKVENKKKEEKIDEKIVPSKDKPKQTKQELSLHDLLDSIVLGYSPEGTDEQKKDAKKTIANYLKQEVNKISEIKDYNLLILYDNSTMIKSDADHIYNAICDFEENKKPLLLVLYSRGGVIGSAYLIGQLCRENSNDCFAITVPRQAKSAATLLCCAADKIHMGSLSELGPIDPQIDDLPALGLKNSIEHIAKLVKETPESAEMFAKYLHYSLRPIDLGYYERVAESAVQYAEKLLSTHADKLPESVSKIANDLVYTYKDHGFVLDIHETTRIFGEDVIETNTPEYIVGNEIYRILGMIENFLSYFNYRFYYIGSLDSEPSINKR